MDCLMITCKSGLLIFIFAENSYSVRQYIYPHCWIKQLGSIRAWVPVSFFLSFSLSLWLILWSIETHHAHSPAWASKTLSRRRTVPSHPWGGAQCLREWRKLCFKSFIGFWHKTRNISLFLSLFYFLIVDSRPPGSGPLKDLNIWGVYGLCSCTGKLGKCFK